MKTLSTLLCIVALFVCALIVGCAPRSRAFTAAPSTSKVSLPDSQILPPLAVSSGFQLHQQYSSNQQATNWKTATEKNVILEKPVLNLQQTRMAMMARSRFDFKICSTCLLAETNTVDAIGSPDVILRL